MSRGVPAGGWAMWRMGRASWVQGQGQGPVLPLRLLRVVLGRLHQFGCRECWRTVDGNLPADTDKMTIIKVQSNPPPAPHPPFDPLETAKAVGHSPLFSTVHPRNPDPKPLR